MQPVASERELALRFPLVIAMVNRPRGGASFAAGKAMGRNLLV